MPSVKRLVAIVMPAIARRSATTPPAASSPDFTVTATLGHSQTDLGGPFVPLMNMSLGNPPQDITAIFDTGSADLIVPDQRGAFCKQPSSNCDDPEKGGEGAFDARKSAGVKDTKSELKTGFTNGETDEGEFIKATGTVGGISFSNFQFGLISTGKPSPDFPEASLRPVLGVSSPLAETNSTKTYPNLPSRMQQAGLIKSRAVSVYTNDFRGNDGSVTFGGIDKAKFTGELKVVRMVPTPDLPPKEEGPGDGSKDETKGSGGKARRGGSWKKWSPRRLRRRKVVRRDERGDANQRGRRVSEKRDDRDAKKENSQGSSKGEDQKSNKEEGQNSQKGNEQDSKKTRLVDYFVELSSLRYIPDQQGPNPNGGGEGKEGNGATRGSKEKRYQNQRHEDKLHKRAEKGESKNSSAEGQGDGKQKKTTEDGSVNLLQQGQKGPALIDTGNPESQVPMVAMRNLAKALEADFDEKEKAISIFDCKKAKGSMRFGFDSDKAVIDVPLEMMLVPKDITQSEGCDLAMTGDDEAVSLGSPFLQAAYAVFDDENKRLMFAQAVINTTRSDIEAMGAATEGKGSIRGTG